MEEIKNKQYKHPALKETLTLTTVCADSIEAFEAMGFKIDDIKKLNKAYSEHCKKKSDIKKLCKLLFNKDLTDKEAGEFPTSIIKIGIMDFLSEYGLLLS